MLPQVIFFMEKDPCCMLPKHRGGGMVGLAVFQPLPFEHKGGLAFYLGFVSHLD